MNGLKVCRNPDCIHAGVPQPEDNYYRRESGRYTMSECKDCMKARSATQATRRVPKSQPYHPTEVLAIQRLAKEGIHALPGKAFSSHYADLVAWGCVTIEVKYSSLKVEYKRPIFHFVTTEPQRRKGFTADLVMLICDYGERQTYHVFPASHPAFYMGTSGRLKTGFVYDPGNPTAGSKHSNSRVVLTDAIMEERENRWSLIEQHRRGVSVALRKKQ